MRTKGFLEKWVKIEVKERTEEWYKNKQINTIKLFEKYLLKFISASS